ncbi:MAG: SAM-dependent methyltransferase, partial [Planctomycetota bacterium]
GEAPPAKVLVIGVGGGIDVLMALSKGASEVVGVDVNPATLSLLTERYRTFTGDLPSRRGVRLLAAEGRAFVRSTEEEFDVLQMSGVDTYAALSSGAYSVSEAYLYTVEAFEDYLEDLRPGGFVSVSRFILEPPRETLRLAGIAAEALRRRGVPEPWRHLAILRGTLWASLLVGESAIPEAALERLRAFAAREGYRLAFDPGRPGDTPFDALLRGSEEEREAFLSGYAYRVSPVGDDSPFFFNYFRWRNLPSVTGIRPADPVYTQPVPVGHAVLLATFLATALLGAIGILVPLRRASVPPGRFGLYFAALGIAYLFVEIAFLQKLTFFLGHPIYALSVVLAGMLLSSGIGAALSRRLSARAADRLLPALLLVLLPACGFASHYVLPAFLDLPFTARVALSLLFLVPCGALMGMPFPIGIERLRARSPAAIPWAFGVNAFATVLASSLSTLLAMEAGFTLLFLLAAAAYAGAFAALRGGPTGPARG